MEMGTRGETRRADLTYRLPLSYALPCPHPDCRKMAISRLGLIIVPNDNQLPITASPIGERDHTIMRGVDRRTTGRGHIDASMKSPCGKHGMEPGTIPAGYDEPGQRTDKTRRSAGARERSAGWLSPDKGKRCEARALDPEARRSPGQFLAAPNGQCNRDVHVFSSVCQASARG